MCLSVVSDKIFCESLSVECRLCFTVLRPPSIGRTPEMDELKSPSKQQSERELVYFKLRCRTSSAQSNSAIGAFVALFFYFSLDELYPPESEWLMTGERSWSLLISRFFKWQSSFLLKVSTVLLPFDHQRWNLKKKFNNS